MFTLLFRDISMGARSQPTGLELKYDSMRKISGLKKFSRKSSKLIPHISRLKGLDKITKSFGRRLMIERSRVRISASDTTWMDRFSQLIGIKLYHCLNRSKINEKEAEDSQYKILRVQRSPNLAWSNGFFVTSFGEPTLRQTCMTRIA